jgi:hypothetical protein
MVYVRTTQEKEKREKRKLAAKEIVFIFELGKKYVKSINTQTWWRED